MLEIGAPTLYLASYYFYQSVFLPGSLLARHKRVRVRDNQDKNCYFRVNKNKKNCRACSHGKFLLILYYFYQSVYIPGSFYLEVCCPDTKGSRSGIIKAKT